MKKIDKFILLTFVKPFIATFLVVIFVLLIHFLVIYFDEFAGKNFGFFIYCELLFYFSFSLAPIAFPLASLLSSLISFGSLGEHGELIALKSAGISLSRILRPAFFFVMLLSIGAYFANNTVVPKMNLKAYSMLYDLRKSKAAVNIKEGVFYSGIPGYSIKIKKKITDEILKGIIIYDHSKKKSNVNITVADSGRMYSMNNGQYLVMEMFNGKSYMETKSKNFRRSYTQLPILDLYRNYFDKNKVVFDLTSLQLERTNEDLFKHNYSMKTISQLSCDIDSMHRRLQTIYKKSFIPYNTSLSSQISILANQSFKAIMDVYVPELSNQKAIFYKAYKAAQNHAYELSEKILMYNSLQKDVKKFELEKYQKLAMAICCMIMFCIGAPLGVVIKRGGLGIPMVIAIIFYLIYYSVNIISSSLAQEGFLDAISAVWVANIILLPIGILFFFLSKKDTRLLEKDLYIILYTRIKKKIFRKLKA